MADLEVEESNRSRKPSSVRFGDDEGDNDNDKNDSNLEEEPKEDHKLVITIEDNSPETDSINR